MPSRSTPLRRAHRDDSNGYIIYTIWNPRGEDINNARHDINDFQQIDFDGDGRISDEELRRLANSDVKISRKNGAMELLSTHPDSLKRVKRLAELEN